jgi:hypothetical protein
VVLEGSSDRKGDERTEEVEDGEGSQRELDSAGGAVDVGAWFEKEGGEAGKRERNRCRWVEWTVAVGRGV